ncbi:MAG: hypothetical protein EBQ92_08805 [Proteobacteria bacterium]|nr:hypothetical protein [Pseudomonadota bacterium]
MTKLTLNRKRLAGLMCWVQSLALAGPHPKKVAEPVGLLWTGSKSNNPLSHQAKIEREVTDEIENSLQRRVVKAHASFRIPPETLRLAKVRKELVKLNQKLSHRALSDRTFFQSDTVEAEALSTEINRYCSQLPRGTFGPEIQMSRLVQSAWFWRKRNKKMFERLCREAAGVHPFREVDFSRLSDEPLKRIFEESCRSAIQVKNLKNCELRQGDNSFEIETPTWINGFPVPTRGREIFPGHYLVIRRDEEGMGFERVIECGNSIQNESGKAWTPISDQVRIEHLIPEKLDGVRDLLILAEEPKGVARYHFDSHSGLSEWNPRREEFASAKPPSFSAGPSEKWYNKKMFGGF